MSRSQKKIIEDEIESENIDTTEEISEEEDDDATKKKKKKLKENIMAWLTHDDRIKMYQKKIKEHKDAKKDIESKVLKGIKDLKMEDKKLDTDGGRVYQSVSVTRGSIKEDTIKMALKGYFKKESHLDEVVKKIDNMRPIKERVYLKRTKGEKGKD